jgi:hypothetical protein
VELWPDITEHDRVRYLDDCRYLDRAARRYRLTQENPTTPPTSTSTPPTSTSISPLSLHSCVSTPPQCLPLPSPLPSPTFSIVSTITELQSLTPVGANLQAL